MCIWEVGILLKSDSLSTGHARLLAQGSHLVTLFFLIPFPLHKLS